MFRGRPLVFLRGWTMAVARGATGFWPGLPAGGLCLVELFF